MARISSHVLIAVESEHQERSRTFVRANTACCLPEAPHSRSDLVISEGPETPFVFASAVKGNVARYDRDWSIAGLSAAIVHLEAEFLHEATRGMSGSRAMIDSPTDMQSVV